MLPAGRRAHTFAPFVMRCRLLCRKKTFSIGSSVLSDADTIGEVCRCDITVLVEHTGTSKYSEVYGEVENIKNLKGTFAGAVVLED